MCLNAWNQHSVTLTVLMKDAPILWEAGQGDLQSLEVGVLDPSLLH